MPADIADVRLRSEALLGRPVQWVLPVRASEDWIEVDSGKEAPRNATLVRWLEGASVVVAGGSLVLVRSVVIALAVLLVSGALIAIVMRDHAGPSQFGVLACDGVNLQLLVGGIYRNYHPKAVAKSYPEGTVVQLVAIVPANLVSRVLIQVCNDDFYVHGWYERDAKRWAIHEA